MKRISVKEVKTGDIVMINEILRNGGYESNGPYKVWHQISEMQFAEPERRKGWWHIQRMGCNNIDGEGETEMFVGEGSRIQNFDLLEPNEVNMLKLKL